MTCKTYGTRASSFLARAAATAAATNVATAKKAAAALTTMMVRTRASAESPSKVRGLLHERRHREEEVPFWNKFRVNRKDTRL